MKIEDCFDITTLDISVPAGCPVAVKGLKDKPLRGLLAALAKARVSINLEDSEKTVVYPQGEEIKETTVPLLTKVKGNLTDYMLRGKGIEISLQDYHKTDGHRRVLGMQVYGGPIHHNAGIHCQIRFEGDYKDGAVVKAAEEALRKFYDSFNIPDSVLQKLKADWPRSKRGNKK